jgi:hypothetical protein
MAEVIEHLYTAPERVMAFFKTLVIQTPNAAAGTRRINREIDVRFYFDARYAHHHLEQRYEPVVGRLKNALFSVLPRSLRLGMTIFAQRGA